MKSYYYIGPTLEGRAPSVHWKGNNNTYGNVEQVNYFLHYIRNHKLEKSLEGSPIPGQLPRYVLTPSYAIYDTYISYCEDHDIPLSDTIIFEALPMPVDMPCVATFLAAHDWLTANGTTNPRLAAVMDGPLTPAVIANFREHLAAANIDIPLASVMSEADICPGTFTLMARKIAFQDF